MKKHIFQRTESRVRVWAAIDPWDLFYVSQRETDRQRDLGELVLVVCVDTEARHWRAGEAGAVRQFPHSTDVTHRFVFQSRRRDFHIVLLVYRLEDKHTHTHTHADGRVYCFCLVKVRNVMWTEIRLWSHSPMKVLEMYSDTWLPERLISDRWDSSLFNILLNCGRMRAKQSEMCRFSKF